MALIIQKFGGTSVADKECLLRVAKIITDTYKKGNNVVVVVSAQGDATNKLIEKSKEINKSPSKRELDVLLSAGEQISSSLLSMMIESLGFPVISLTGWQAGFRTDSNYTTARIKKIDSERLKKELDARKIIIVAGFQGLNRYDDITTFGRGGSDTTAVALAVELKADLCQIYTDVTGVFTTDPKKIDTAVKLDEISYEEMLELASLGAKVLHSRSVELAQKYNINVEVLSSKVCEKGTVVKEVKSMEKMIVKGVSIIDYISKISIIGIKDTPGIEFKIFSFLSLKKINVDIILQTKELDGTKNIHMTVPLEESEDAYKIIKENLSFFDAKNLTVNNQVSKLSIVGSGMQSNPGVASKMFESLFEHGIGIEMISTSEIKISVLINRKDGLKSLKVVHDAFIQ